MYRLLIIPLFLILTSCAKPVDLADTGAQVNLTTGPTVTASDWASTINAMTAEVYSTKADVSSVPTALSQLSTDTTHRVVSDTEIATWNAKLSAEVDGSVTNEIQALSINGSNLSLSNGGGTVAIPAGGADNLGTATAADVSALYSGSGYLKSDGTADTPTGSVPSGSDGQIIGYVGTTPTAIDADTITVSSPLAYNTSTNTLSVDLSGYETTDAGCETVLSAPYRDSTGSDGECQLYGGTAYIHSGGYWSTWSAYTDNLSSAPGSSGEVVGDNASGGAEITTWSGSNTYFCKVNGLPTVNGQLDHYEISLSSSTANRAVKLALYTHNSSTNKPDTLVSGSETGEVYYTSATGGGIVEIPATASPATVSGATYWIGYKLSNYARPFGATIGGECINASAYAYSAEFGADWDVAYPTNVFTTTDKPSSWAFVH
jgi:hypothetical protein